MLSSTFPHHVYSRNFEINEAGLNAHVRQAVSRMLDWCSRNAQGATFAARGLVIDTLTDVGQQIRTFFPAHIDIAPVLDDIAFVVAQSAKASGQRFQEIVLDYIADGRIPQTARANLQSFVKWYGVEGGLGDNFDGRHQKLRPGWSGGAGTPTGLLRYLNLASKKGFLLQVSALDIDDAKANALLAGLTLVQAFGGSPAALQSAAESTTRGGPEAFVTNAVGALIAEIKTIRAALTNEPDLPQASSLVAALATKIDSLSSQMTLVPRASLIRTEIARSVEIVRADLQGHRIAHAIELLATDKRTSTNGRTNDRVPTTSGIPIHIGQAIVALETAARTARIPVRDVVALAMTGDAPPALVLAVKSLSAVLTSQGLLPVLRRAALPEMTRPATTTPPAAEIQAPILPLLTMAPVVRSLQSLAASVPELPTLQMAALVLEQSTTAPAPQRAQALESVADNLYAITLSAGVPADAMSSIKAVVQQVHVLAAQDRISAQAVPTRPTEAARAVSPVVPITQLTTAPLPAPAPHPAERSDVVALGAGVVGVVVVSAVSAPALRPASPKAEQPETEKPVGKRCAGCFNGSCGSCSALNDVVVASMQAEILAYASAKPDGAKRPMISQPAP